MTTNKITESDIEKFAIELLEKQGYQYIYALDIAPDSDAPERSSFEDVLLLERLQTAVGRINPGIPADARDDAIRQIHSISERISFFSWMAPWQSSELLHAASKQSKDLYSLDILRISYEESRTACPKPFGN